MDEIVLRGMAKWPNVPAVYGWLALDRRGNWLIKGSRVGNPIVAEFIGRNYARDAEGRWYFQNGPQRVFVELAYTPLVYRLQALPATHGCELRAHTGQTAQAARAACIDEAETFVVDTDLGPGVIDDRDLAQLPAYLVGAGGHALDDDALIEAMQAPERAALGLRYRDATIPVRTIRSDEVGTRFDFIARPEPPPGVEACS
ncbi:MAG TPA: DUF2946 family protein [Burkholderiales bacterium]|nr:DUF2946 family protein [Burkholderiales bacterium]